MASIRNYSAALLGAVCVHGAAADGSAANTLSTRWMSAYNSGNLKALAAIYATDARVQHGYCAPVGGRDAIEAFWNGDVGEKGSQTQLYVVDSFELDGLVYLSGTYAVEEPRGEAEPIGGSFMQIWRRDGEAEWNVFRESWINLACLEVLSDRNPPDAPSAGSPAIAL